MLSQSLELQQSGGDLGFGRGDRRKEPEGNEDEGVSGLGDPAWYTFTKENDGKSPVFTGKL